MLVLSRKEGQILHIGSDITISVLSVTGKSVRIGINAPDSVNILRGEVKEQIEEENRLAALRAGRIDDLVKLGPFGEFAPRPIMQRDDDDCGRPDDTVS